MNNIDKITKEYENACEKFPDFNSGHEGIGVIREEYLELEKEIFWGKERAKAINECVQLGAMCLRLLDYLEKGRMY